MDGKGKGKGRGRGRGGSSGFRIRALLLVISFTLLVLSGMTHQATDPDHLQNHHHSNLNFIISARKVPNGPDPIHNRRAKNSGRPPGRS